MKSNAEWHPVRERALAQGLFNAGASVGAIVAAPLIALLYIQFGWRTTFVLIGGLGLLWIIPWWVVNRATPAHHPWLTPAERDLILHSDAPAAQAAPSIGWRALLAARPAWGVLLGRFFLDPVWFLFISWMPIYLADTFGFDIKQIGLFAWMPYVGAAIGSVGGGIMLVALVISAFMTTPVTAIAAITMVMFGFQIAIGNVQTLASDLHAGRSVGSLAGLSGTAGVVGVLITTWLVPVITRADYVPFFLLAATCVPFGVIAVLWLCRRPAATAP